MAPGEVKMLQLEVAHALREESRGQHSVRATERLPQLRVEGEDRDGKWYIWDLDASLPRRVSAVVGL